MSHRILILGSLDEFVELVKLSKKRGYYTIVCDGYMNGPAKEYADKSYTVDVRNVDEIVKICKEENIDGIMGSFSDLLFEQITKIADQAGLKWYVKPEMLPYYREKNEAKRLMQECGIRVPKNCILKKNFGDEALAGFTFPLVIKPVNGYGSKGIYVVHCIEEIREKYDMITCRSTMEEIQVEEYSHGREYNMMTWLIDGEVNVISIADREKNPQEGDTVPLLNRIVYPAKNIHVIIDEAKKVLTKFAKKTGQKEGALSMQFFYNENGVEVCEIAGRLFGYEHELVTHCCGFSIEDMLLDYVYDRESLVKMLSDHAPFFNKHCAGIYFVGEQDKVIKELENVRTLAKNPHVIEAIAYYKEGEVIDNYGSKPYLARYYLTAENREKLDDICEYFFEHMQVTAEDESELAKKFVLDRSE